MLGPVVVIVNLTVAELSSARLTDCGLRAQVGAKIGVGVTEQDSNTEPANPLAAVNVRSKSTDDPDFTETLPGLAPIAESFARTTTWLKATGYEG